MDEILYEIMYNGFKEWRAQLFTGINFLNEKLE